jgi:sugar/nucleoside kinase (ribokinase family)
VDGVAVVVVAGVVNVETSLPVEALPVSYVPVRYVRGQLRSRASGVGFNVAAALACLGAEVRLASYLGGDALGGLAREELAARRLDGPGVLATSATAQSVVATAPDGRRMVFTDVKDLPDETYPAEVFDGLLDGADLAVISTIGFARSLLPAAQARGVPIAVDVQAVDRADDPYLQDWLNRADVLFCSDERLPAPAEEWAEALLERHDAGVVVVGCGAAGCLLCVRGEAPRRVPAVAPRGVTSTVGAGDALFAGFLDGRARGLDPQMAIERAVLFAGWKVGSAGGAEGLLTGPELDQFFQARRTVPAAG